MVAGHPSKPAELNHSVWCGMAHLAERWRLPLVVWRGPTLKGGIMRLGDYILCASMTLNVLAMAAYAWQGVWHLAWYWLAALQLNAAILWGMK